MNGKFNNETKKKQFTTIQFNSIVLSNTIIVKNIYIYIYQNLGVTSFVDDTLIFSVLYL